MIGGNIRESTVLSVWRKRTGLRKMAGRRYDVLSKSCMLMRGDEKSGTRSGLKWFQDSYCLATLDILGGSEAECANYG